MTLSTTKLGTTASARTRAIPTVSVVGWHNVGKTTFVERLIAVLKARGTRVATIKHSREDFDMDQQGTDSWRYRQAGSDVVVISALARLALIEAREEEATLEEIIERLPEGIGLVITEGYKRLPLKKIEVTTRQAWERDGRVAANEQLLALVTDDDIPDRGDAPVFRRHDAAGVADLLERMGMVHRGG